MPVDLVEGLLLVLGVAVVLTGTRFLLALARGEDPRESFMITGRWSLSLLAAAGAAGSMGLIQLGDIVGMATTFISTHPFAVSNGIVAGLGAAVSGGLLSVSPAQFMGIAIAVVGLVMLLYEVEEEV